MTDSTGTPSTPAGWYADPAGSDRLRWWDGTRWTDHLTDVPKAAASADAAHAPASPATYVPPAGSQPPYGQQAHAQQPYAQQPYSQAGYAPQAPAPLPTVPASTSPFTWAIWVLAALPVISILIALSVDYRAALDMSPRGPSPEAAVASALSSLVQFLMWAATVALAFFDWRDLTRRGIAKPFHWAWAFIPVAGGVYLIGRSIVVRRRIEGTPATALSPIWLWVGLNVIVMFISVVKGVEAATSLMQRYGTPGY
ncbi:DUF2510 domain-containing protein [Clavibacter michiganensis]|uniref:DUF2510 domain-containing protein n=1 Tax=Clavibacter michiganensis TaxID=28447 RepID=UPI0005BE41D0|nr:DUF2510 domain-containing protein [Clavibacter michiganensis]